MSPESRAKTARAFAFRNAVAEAGTCVLAAAAEGDPEKVAAIAAERLADVRRQFAGDPLIYRILPPSDETTAGPGVAQTPDPANR
jgi:hypothetical protein